MSDAPSASSTTNSLPSVGTETSSVPTTRLPESRVLSEIFLSPRVIDREAYNDYAGSLKALIESAAREAEALRVAANDAAIARGALREVAGKTQPKLEAAARVMATIDARAKEAEEMLQAAREAAGTLNTARDQAEHAIRTEVAGLEMRLASIDQRVEEQVRQAELKAAQVAAAYEAKLQQKLADMESRHAGFGTTIDTLAILIARAETLLETKAQGGGAAASIPELISRTEAVQRRADATIAELDGARDRAEQARAGLADALGGGAARIEELSLAAADVRRTVEEALAECRQAQQTAQARREELRAAAAEPMAELEVHARAVSQRLEMATRIADQSSAGAAAVVEKLGALLDELRPWKAVLLEDRAAGQLPPALGRVIEDVKQELAGDFARVTSALSQALARPRG